MVAFNTIPNANRVPAGYVEVDGSQALASQPGAIPHVLIIGLRAASGTVAEGVPFSVVGELAADAPAGVDSQLAVAARAFKRINKSAQLTCIGLDDVGTAATGSIAYSGTATETRVQPLRIGDIRVNVSIVEGDTATVVGGKAVAAMAAEARCPITGINTTGTVATTDKAAAESGNDITLEVEEEVAGIGVVITQPSGGATNPDVDDAIAGFTDERYDRIVTLITDAANMAKLENEMANRWAPLAKQPGQVMAAVRGTHGALTTYGNGRNSRFSTVMGCGPSKSPSWVFAAQMTARDVAEPKPNRPLNGLTLPDCEGPSLADMGSFDAAARNLLLTDGISTFKMDQSGAVMVERLITTYQTDANSLPDLTYLAHTTQKTLAFLYLRRLAIFARYSRHNLADDGTQADPGTAVITPSTLRGVLLDDYQVIERAGIVEDFDTFRDTLIVERPDDDQERIDIQMADNIANELVTIAAQLQFRL